MIETPFKLGWIPDLPDIRDIPFKAAAAPGVVYPPSKRLVWVPGALEQGPLGSCVANAVALAVQYARIKQRKLHAWQPARLPVYYGAREIRGWEAIDSGCHIRDAIKVVASQGTAKEEDYPYVISKFAEKPPPSYYEQALRDQVLLYRRIDNTNLDDIRAALNEDYPIVFGFSLYNDFNWSGVNDGSITMPGGGGASYVVGGHACLIAAYDDLQGRCEFVNSWGKKWGKLGRGSIPYNYLTNPGLASDFWQISLVE